MPVQSTWALACGPLSLQEHLAATTITPATVSALGEPLVLCDVQLTSRLDEGIFVYMGNDSKRLYQASRLDGDALMHHGIAQAHAQSQEQLEAHHELISQLSSGGSDLGAQSGSTGLVPIGSTRQGAWIMFP